MNSKEALERLLDDYEYLMEKYYPIKDIKNQQINNTKNNVNQIKQDLDRLELIKCLEETLGIELFILFGALKNGIYYKSFDGDINHISYRVLTLSYNYGFNIWVEGHRKFDGLLIDFKDYGKTWALTKEELQNDK